MQISRKTMDTVLKFPKLNLAELDDATVNTIELRLRTLFDQLPQITSIERVKNLDGAKYLIQTAIVETLEKIGRPIDEMTLTQLAVEDFLAADLPA